MNYLDAYEIGPPRYASSEVLLYSSMDEDIAVEILNIARKRTECFTYGAKSCNCY